MHEVSIMESLHEQLVSLAREHGASRVRRVAVEVGELSNVVPEMLNQAFLAFREVEPLLAGATFEIRRLPLRLRCRACGAETEPEGYRLRCSGCGGTGVDVIQGEELLLRDVELEIESEVECDDRH